MSDRKRAKYGLLRSWPAVETQTEGIVGSGLHSPACIRIHAVCTLGNVVVFIWHRSQVCASDRSDCR